MNIDLLQGREQSSYPLLLNLQRNDRSLGIGEAQGVYVPVRMSVTAAPERRLHFNIIANKLLNYSHCLGQAGCCFHHSLCNEINGSAVSLKTRLQQYPDSRFFHRLLFSFEISQFSMGGKCWLFLSMTSAIIESGPSDLQYCCNHCHWDQLILMIDFSF